MIFTYFSVMTIIHRQIDFYAFSQFCLHSGEARIFKLFKMKQEEMAISLGVLGKDFYNRIQNVITFVLKEGVAKIILPNLCFVVKNCSCNLATLPQGGDRELQSLGSSA